MSDSGVSAGGSAHTTAKARKSELDKELQELKRERVKIYQKGGQRMTEGVNKTAASDQAWRHSKKNSKAKPLPDEKRFQNVVKLEQKYPFLNISKELVDNWDAQTKVLKLRDNLVISS